MFGSKVLAEIPKSVEQLNPNLTRFVSACLPSSAVFILWESGAG